MHLQLASKSQGLRWCEYEPKLLKHNNRINNNRLTVHEFYNGRNNSITSNSRITMNKEDRSKCQKKDRDENNKVEANKNKQHNNVYLKRQNKDIHQRKFLTPNVNTGNSDGILSNPKTEAHYIFQIINAMYHK